MQKSTQAVTATERTRVNFGKIPEAMELPNLISVQKQSFQRFMDEGLREAFRESNPIQSQNHMLEVTFGAHQFGDPSHSVEECREKDMTYQAPLLTDVRLTNKETGEIKEQLVFMGDFPMMTDQGTFIINGTERIVVSQLVRSPGVYYSSEMDGGKQVYKAQIIPARGAWLEFEVDKRDQLVVSIDRKRKQSATMFLRALGIAPTNDEIFELLGDSDVVKRTIERDTALTREDALIEIYRRLRPGEPPTVDASRSLLEGLLFNPQRYDLARVGRYKVNKKLNLTTGEEVTVLTDEDIVATLRYLLSLAAGEAGFKVDDIDHFGNRRIRTVGELVANQFRIGMSRMERVVRERMSSQDIDEITPQSLINIRPIVASIKEFFGSSQLSQFMDQANPLTGLTHKRRLSSLGRATSTAPSALPPTCRSKPSPTRTSPRVSCSPSRPRSSRSSSTTTPTARSWVRTCSARPSRSWSRNRRSSAPAWRSAPRVIPARSEPGFKVDDIDHFGNRRIRTVGELVANQFRIGMSRMERVVRERMSSQDVDEITPQSLINIRPIVAAIKEFFGSSQLSQIMDQANPLTGLTHKRRLSALGPGGLAGHKSGSSRRTNVPTAVRDVHNSHYSRMCPIETPEGPNIGLIGSLALYARVNEYGFIEAPYRKVVNGQVTDQIDWMTADEEENHIIAPANTPINPDTNEFVARDMDGNLVRPHTIVARTRDFDGSFGAPADVLVSDVDYMDVSPRQMISVAPYVGTGMERRAAIDSGEVTMAKNPGEVVFADASKIIVKSAAGMDEYHLPKYQRSNQSTCINHRPLVRVGDEVAQGQPLADGPSTDHGELALGQNLTVAYMPWEGFNYEDGIVVSERVVQEDLLTSINISRHEIDARDTKLGPEEVTREIPNLSEDMLADLDDDGIIRIGAEVGPGDILVGKVTPKGETALTAEERLLRAIFGAKAHDVRDTSLKMPHGAYGRVVDVVRFSREAGDDLPPGVNEMVRVFVAQRRKIQEGDKIAGRHGNKGVVCRVLPVEDMPYMADGTPIDVLLDPLGVPSRMNVGQLLECHLGWCAANGWDIDSAESDHYVPGPMPVATPVFDGATGDEVAECIRRTNINLINKAKEQYGDKMDEVFVPQLNAMGKATLYDGRTGEPFRDPVTVGTNYVLKLGHMVDDKIHARSTGPYSLITQQPLGGKAQFGGQRFGEMEVWALYAYGAANVLQEILTVKSDDTNGRVKTYESIVKGENVPEPGIPEAFRVLVKEIRSLALDIEPLSYKKVEEPVATSVEADVVGTFANDDLIGAPLAAEPAVDDLVGSIDTVKE